jgi:hypothetical protein
LVKNQMGQRVMPGFSDQYWLDHQSVYLKQCTWTVKRPLIPKRDALSDKLLWLKPAMKGVRFFQDPFPPEVYWVDREEFVMHKLKGTI